MSEIPGITDPQRYRKAPQTAQLQWAENERELGYRQYDYNSLKTKIEALLDEAKRLAQLRAV